MKALNNHLEMNDEQFEALFKAKNFDPALFTHETHLRLAWIHIRKYGVATAITNIRKQLKAFVAEIGAEEKYNDTVTVAGIHAVNHFMKKTRVSTFTDFIENNRRLITHFREILGFHYSTDIFVSDLAKRSYLEPELLPFD